MTDRPILFLHTDVVVRVAASRLNIRADALAEKLNSGMKFCGKCREWKPATDGESKHLPPGDVMFHLTRAGAEAALLPGDKLDPEVWK